MAEKYPVNLQKDETVVKLIRRHPVRMILDIVLTVIVMLLVAAALVWLQSVLSFAWVWGSMGLIVALGGLAFIGIEFYRYRNDVWLLTNQRIVDSTRNSPFNQSVSSADLVNVQDMNYHRRGVLATVFKFGDVTCQTASQTQLFVFRGVPHPEQLLELVDAQRDAARNRLYKTE